MAKLAENPIVPPDTAVIVALEPIPQPVNGHRAANLYVKIGDRDSQCYQSRANAAIDALNSWIREGAQVVTPEQLGINHNPEVLVLTGKPGPTAPLPWQPFSPEDREG